MTRSNVLAFIMDIGPATEEDILFAFGREGEQVVKDLLELRAVTKRPFRGKFEFSANHMGVYSRYE